MSIGHTLNHLTWDTEYEIAASALRTQAMYNRAHTKQPADAGAEAHKEKVHDPSEDMVLALPEVVGSMISPPSMTPSPSYQAEQRDDKPSDELLKTLEELCRELHGRHFSPADQERISDALSRAWMRTRR
jgi:hypothetical protein